MASIPQRRYFMRDCADVPSRQLTPAGRFWLGYLAGVTVCVVSIIVLGYREAILAAVAS